MSAKLFEAALGIAEPGVIEEVDFDAGNKTIVRRQRFALAGFVPLRG